MSDASDRLMVVRLKLSKWSPRKYDKKASEQVAKAHGARDAREVGRFNKILVDLDEMRALESAYSGLRNDHYFMTAPWTDEGMRVLPSETFAEYCEYVKAGTEEIDKAKEELFAKWPTLVEKAKTTLNGLFNEEDYPSLADLKSRYSVDLHVETLPDPADFRVLAGIDDDQAAKLAKDMTESLAKATAAAHREVVERVFARAREFIDRVRKYEASAAAKATTGERQFPLHESALENLRDVVSLVIDGLNISGDANLTKMAEELWDHIDGLEVDELKDKPAVRAVAVADVEKVLNRFQGVL